MHSPDFLHKDAETNLCEHFLAAGTVCRIATNCESLLKAARESFMPLEMPPDALDFSLRFWVDDTTPSRSPWPNPYVRGLDHLVFAGFDAESSLLVNLHTRHVIGRFSAAMGADIPHWRTVVFPILLSILAGSIGLVELHASCVARDRLGLILAGPSRSGKSTLAMALTEAGFSFLSDDRTFCSLKQGKLLAWGLPRPLKLRPEAATWFEKFRDREPTDVQNRERVFHFDPERQRVLQCQPRLLIFLDRREDNGFEMTPMRYNEARVRIEQDLLAETPAAIRKQSESLDELLWLPCFALRYGGRPQMIAGKLAESFLNGCECRM